MLSTRITQRHSGFTLIELLVVIFLMLTLAALTVAFFPGINEQARAARGGVVLQGWINVAKQRALRDQSPRGLRLWLDSASNIVGAYQYIEVPDDFSRGAIATEPADRSKIVFTVNLTGGSSNPEEWAAKPGDYLEVLGGGLAHMITFVDSSTGVNVTLASPLPFDLSSTSNYRIRRAPRVVADEILELPDGVGVDIGTNELLPKNPLPIVTDSSGNKYLDILFAPSGEVITPGVTTASFNLWVRDTTEPSLGAYDALGNVRRDPTIIAVYVRSGFVAAHPPYPDPTYAQRYKYVDDGRSSGK